MSIEFLLTALVVVLIPGTGVVYTVTASLRGGARLGAFAAVGCTLGIVPHLLAAALLLAGVLDAVPAAVDGIRYVGAAYLAWLGVQLVRHGAFQPPAEGEDDTPPNAAATVARGVLINVLNPKLLVFFLSFLPQFVPVGAGQASTLVALSATFMGMTLAVFVGYAALSGVLSRRLLASERSSRRATGVLGGALVALALQLAVSA